MSDRVKKLIDMLLLREDYKKYKQNFKKNLNNISYKKSMENWLYFFYRRNPLNFYIEFKTSNNIETFYVTRKIESSSSLMMDFLIIKK